MLDCLLVSSSSLQSRRKFVTVGFLGALAIGSACLPPSKRPLIGLLMGLAYGVGAVLGPLLGGS